MSWASRDLGRFQDLSRAEQRLLIEAIGWLGLLRAAVLLLPYRRVASLLRLTQSGAAQLPAASSAARGAAGGGRPGAAALGAAEADGAPGVPGAADSRAAEAIGWAVQAAAARTPWLSTCLVQSLAGCTMLRRHRLPSVVYLGVTKGARGEFRAHSWLQCGDQLVTGGASRPQYSVIAGYQPAMGRLG